MDNVQNYDSCINIPLLQSFVSYYVNPHVEADKNVSTVIPASCKRRRKRSPVASDETVMYGYESSATLTTDRVQYSL
jgi:hypothetical protein